jgi:hypothetical protein
MQRRQGQYPIQVPTSVPARPRSGTVPPHNPCKFAAISSTPANLQHPRVPSPAPPQTYGALANHLRQDPANLWRPREPSPARPSRLPHYPARPTSPRPQHQGGQDRREEHRSPFLDRPRDELLAKPNLGNHAVPATVPQMPHLAAIVLWRELRANFMKD